MRNATVIGLGRSGVAAAKLLRREGWTVTASDSGNSAALQQLQQSLATEGIALKLGDRFAPDAATMQLVVVSPGVPWDLPSLKQARSLGIETIGEIELAWRSLSQLPWVGITGTNGKTTTTALIAAIFQAAGYDAPACGNIGFAACELALAEPLPNWVIAELSSYQIEAAATVAPQIGVWTTFTPDHLSRHYTLENYFAIKASLLNRSQHCVINGDDPFLRQQGQDRTSSLAKTGQDWCWTSVAGKAHLLGDVDRGAYVEDGWAVAQGEAIVPVSALRMVGAHNQQNLLMAVLTAKLAGLEAAAIRQAIEAFPGVPHRLEQICTWHGIDFVNDSKATNYDAAAVGLSAVAAPVVLIAGGEAKAGDDTGWLQQIQDKAAAVLLIGVAAPAFADRLNAIGYTQHETVTTLDRAVARGAELAESRAARVVLFSPACASFDQYANFEARGDHFRQLCQQLLV